MQLRQQAFHCPYGNLRPSASLRYKFIRKSLPKSISSGSRSPYCFASRNILGIPLMKTVASFSSYQDYKHAPTKCQTKSDRFLFSSPCDRTTIKSILISFFKISPDFFPLSAAVFLRLKMPVIENSPSFVMSSLPERSYL